jgi:hypothetical protein
VKFYIKDIQKNIELKNTQEYIDTGIDLLTSVMNQLLKELYKQDPKDEFTRILSAFYNTLNVYKGGRCKQHKRK